MLKEFWWKNFMDNTSFKYKERDGNIGYYDGS